MEIRKADIAIAVRSESYEDVTIPGVIVELDAAAAEDLGAFEDSALTEVDAWESNMDLQEEGGRHG
jgi:hypothetical protein